ncbi:MAG TPA: hypothetical protein VE954_07320 [Oligoflexus sp.]|uniref:hypothetical protein n=1 Tax=Oligoflexus sp. TaxID=1971216 RepID=UPI002D542A7F|nr:hypothetical protein [Oligoflexus sp.]HYX32908.1 hypothetical protein [Oligoflexus sp.]
MKFLFCISMVFSLLATRALAFDVTLKKADNSNNRMLVEGRTDDTQFLSDGDTLFLTDGTRYLKVKVVRVINQSLILLQCPAGQGCQTIASESLALYQSNELPAAVNPMKEDQEVFHDSHAVQVYGKNLREIGRYIQSEVDVKLPAGKNLQDRYHHLVRKEDFGRVVSYPLIGAGFVGMLLYGLVSPSSNEQDDRTEKQKDNAFKLGMGSLASIGLGFGLYFTLRPSDQEIEGLIDSIEENESRARKVSVSSWNLRPHVSFEARQSTLGLNLNF